MRGLRPDVEGLSRTNRRLRLLLTKGNRSSQGECENKGWVEMCYIVFRRANVSKIHILNSSSSDRSIRLSDDVDLDEMA